MAYRNLKVTGVTKSFASRPFRVHCMTENNPPRKKGPHRMATAYRPETQDESQITELDATVNAFAKKAHSVIEESRSKMTEEEAAEADAKAKAIFDRASAAAKRTRRGA